jgi:aryl-alcohol dehydrogenase-like predicted oxidoreductase
MKKRKLGGEIEVTELGLGTMYFGWREPKENSIERLNQYAEAGGNFIDTANMYSNHMLGFFDSSLDFYGKDRSKFVGGLSERLIGEWLKNRRIRDKFVLATKIGSPYPGVEFGTSAKQLKTECDNCLRRLQTDYIDLLYLHVDDRNTSFEESLGALNDLVKQGKVRYIGASNFTSWRLAEAVETAKRCSFPKFIALQQQRTYVRMKMGWSIPFQGDETCTDDVLAYLRYSGISLVAYSPLQSGAYVRSDRSFGEHFEGEDTNARLKVLDEIAKETGATKNQIVYYWILHADPPAIPLVASSTKAQFDEALGSLSLNISPEQMERLSNAKA